MYYYRYKTPVGTITVSADDTCIAGLRFGASHVTDGDSEKEIPLISEACRQISEYFAGTRREFTLPLCYRGSEFETRIWRLLTGIPYGTTITYGCLAERAGNPKAARAVGGACGRNPIAIIVPCHRVIGANGSLTGFAGGTDIKKRLLETEKPQLSSAL